jgi:SulP family sulfate permease
VPLGLPDEPFERRGGSRVEHRHAGKIEHIGLRMLADPVEGGADIRRRADDGNGERVPYDAKLAVDREVLVYRITGAFFFGAASAVGGVLDSIADKRKAFVVDFTAVPFLDSTAANAMGRVAAKAHRQGIRLFITGASPTVRRALLTHGVIPPRARYRETIARAVADIKGSAAGPVVRSDDLAAS